MQKKCETDPLIALGKIVRARGLKGEVQVYPYTNNPNNFLEYGDLFVGSLEKGFKAMTLKKVQRVDNKRVMAFFEGIGDRNQAEALIGCEIFVPREKLPALSEDEYYWNDLIGLLVITNKGEKVGRITDIFETGAHDVYVIKGEMGEVLVPAIDEVVSKIDLKKGLMVIDPVPGLLEANAL